ncbi:hypothetical protein [Microbacterium sp. NPDC087589]|uniref:hypothetical protein n=1 Tax=Microbacterium sp. NPDC087589 TaxID=3364191 RepID=UPI003812295E
MTTEVPTTTTTGLHPGLTRRQISMMPMRMWGFPWLSWLCLALLAGVIALSMIDPAARVQLLLTIGLTAVLVVVARLTRDTSRAGVDG